MEKTPITKGIKELYPKIIKWIKGHQKEALIVLVILLVGAFFRLYRISEYMTFLGDEGRDVIVVRRLLVNFDPVLIGPGTSVGNMYLGPLYYYMMAPSLLLANFSPVGPSVQIAILGVVTIFFVWFVAREWFGKYAAIIAGSLYAVSPVIIVHARSSWNPNIMPFFALLVIYSLWKMKRETNWKWLIVASVSFAFVLQSHYLGLILGPLVFVYWLMAFKRHLGSKKEKMRAIYYSLFSVFLFLFLMSPLVLFDARHGWRNFSSMKTFFSERQGTISAKPWMAIPNLLPLLKNISTRLLGGADGLVGMGLMIIALIGLIWLGALVWKKLGSVQKQAFILIGLWLGFGLIGLGIYKQEMYDHYFGFLFPAPFLLLGGIAENVIGRIKRIGMIIVGIGTALLVFVNIQNNPLKYPPNRQLQRTKEVVAKMVQEAGEEKFNFAVVAERNYEGAYQYFLENWNAPFVIIDPQRADETIVEQLFVVCEYPPEECQPTSNPKAEVANFGWSKIDKQWQVGGVILYKLVHNYPDGR